jgi:hypothetical protein
MAQKPKPKRAYPARRGKKVVTEHNAWGFSLGTKVARSSMTNKEIANRGNKRRMGFSNPSGEKKKGNRKYTGGTF